MGRPHRWLALALVAGVVAILAQSFVGGAQATSTVAPHGVVVVGDSITANYNHRPGDARQGWWSIVARELNADVTTRAQSGSGYVRSGKGCTGERFIDRNGVFDRATPALFLIEGGRNDWAYCYRGEHVRAPDTMIRISVEAFYEQLLSSIPDGSRVVVLGPPWGPHQSDEASRVTAIIAEVTQQLGLEFIDTSGTLSRRDRVVDGIHPNRSGSEAIARVVLDALRP